MSKKPGSGGDPGAQDSEDERDLTGSHSLDDIDLESLLLEDVADFPSEEEDGPASHAANGKGLVAPASQPLIIDDGELDLLDAGNQGDDGDDGLDAPRSGAGGGDDSAGGDARFEEFIDALYEDRPAGDGDHEEGGDPGMDPVDDPVDELVEDPVEEVAPPAAAPAGGAEGPAGGKGRKSVAAEHAADEDRGPEEWNRGQEKERVMAESPKKAKGAGAGKKGVAKAPRSPKKAAARAPKPAKERAPHAASGSAKGTVAFICSECYEEFLIPAGYGSETLSCPECLHVGKRSDENFILKVLTHKSGERNSALLAIVAGIVLAGILVTLLLKLSPFALAEGAKPDESTPLFLLIGAGVMTLVFLFFIWRAEKNRWEAYF